MNDADRDQPDTPQGPEDPHGTGGLDAPPPPGGPQRTDQPAPGCDARRPGRGSAQPRLRPPRRVARADSPGDESDADDLQAENAGTSLDEPSDSTE